MNCDCLGKDNLSIMRVKFLQLLIESKSSLCRNIDYWGMGRIDKYIILVFNSFEIHYLNKRIRIYDLRMIRPLKSYKRIAHKSNNIFTIYCAIYIKRLNKKLKQISGPPIVNHSCINQSYLHINVLKL